MPFRISITQTDVKQALTDQGYTTGRSAKIDNLDATISSRPAAIDYSAARAAKLDQLDAAISSRAAPGAAMDLNAVAKTAIWNEAIPGIPTAGSYGERVKNNLDATITSRPAATDYSAARAAKLDNLDAVISSRAAPGAAMDLNATAKTAIWNEVIPGIPTAGSYGERVKNNLDATITSRPAATDYSAARAAKLDNLDAAISSRAAPGAAMALASPYDARLDAAISTRAAAADYTAARAAKIDNLDAAITTRAAPGAAMGLASPYDARLDAAITTRASPTDVDTKLGDRGITTARMGKLDLVAAQAANEGSVAAVGNTTGLTVSLDTGGAAGQARAVVEVRYSCGAAAELYAEGSDDNTTWYEGDHISEGAAASNKLVGYLNAHRYFRFRSPTTGIDLSFYLKALL